MALSRNKRFDEDAWNKSGTEQLKYQPREAGALLLVVHGDTLRYSKDLDKRNRTRKQFASAWGWLSESDDGIWRLVKSFYDDILSPASTTLLDDVRDGLEDRVGSTIAKRVKVTAETTFTHRRGDGVTAVLEFARIAPEMTDAARWQWLASFCLDNFEGQSIPYKELRAILEDDLDNPFGFGGADIKAQVMRTLERYDTSDLPMLHSVERVPFGDERVIAWLEGKALEQ
jgi:hypothetical protein